MPKNLISSYQPQPIVEAHQIEEGEESFQDLKETPKNILQLVFLPPHRLTFNV